MKNNFILTVLLLLYSFGYAQKKILEYKIGDEDGVGVLVLADTATY